MNELEVFICPACGGKIDNNEAGENQEYTRFKCNFCGNDYDIDTLTQYTESVNSDTDDSFTWESLAGSEWTEGDIANMKSFVCGSCGGGFIGDQNMSLSKCPYCNSAVVPSRDFSGNLKPDYVIPFKIEKETVKKKLKKYYKSKKLLPKSFKDESHIDEIKGIYAPFWLFDCDVQANIRYRATKIDKIDDSKTKSENYALIRNGKISYEHVPVDGSTRLNDELMESIEPFRFKDAVDYKPEYLEGFYVDRFDVDAKTSEHRAGERVKRATESTFMTNVSNYDSVAPENSDITLTNGKARYALYPIWMLTTNWKGKKYIFAMNGQTGKFVGDLPMSKKLLFKYLFEVWGIVSLIAFIAAYIYNYVSTKVLFPKDGAFWGYRAIAALVVGLLVSIIYTLILKAKLTKAPKKSVAPSYAKDRSMKLTDKRDVFLYTTEEEK